MVSIRGFRPLAFVIMLAMLAAGFGGVALPATSSEEIDGAPTIAKGDLSFDFGSRGSPVMNFNTGVTSSTIYTSELGYGLLEPANGFQVTGRMLAEVSPHVLQRSWVYNEYGNDLTVDGLRSEDKVSFRVDLPNGTYRLVLWLGDLEKGVYSLNISVNDEWLLEGADAFHNVFRSIYYKFQPDPRDPGKEYINYGMAVPYYLKVNVTQGHMIINVTGNDDTYWDLLAAELAKDPANSYLTWMSTGGIKKSGGTGPWRYIGGPFTNASVMGLNIHPYPDFPIDGEMGELSADPDINASDVLSGISAANSGNLESAFLHWKSGMDDDLSGRNRLARSQLGLILAGSLNLDREIEILPAVEPDIFTNTDLRGDPAQVELWTWANIANRGLHYEFNRTMYAGDGQKKNHFFEANKAFVLLNQIPEISPLYPKMELWSARCLMNLDPHRWTSASGTALEMMEDLRPLDPDNPYIKMYLDTTREDPPTWESPTPVISTTGTYDNWTLNDYNTGYEDAPEWASLIHEELGWLYDVTDWWVDNRMQENGYLGGGWTDDVEMIGLFGFDALISEGADDKSLEGAGRFVDGMLASGQVNMSLGYSEAFADVEHTAELTGDSLPMMVAVDFGNPKWIEFSTKTAVLMRDLWMGENEKGWYQFKANYMSATRIGTGGQAEDSWINFRAALPALWAWWYSNDPEVQQLIVDWADCWVNAALSTEKEKPMGVIPAGIGWPNGEIGGHNSPNWYTAAHPPGSVNYDWSPQKYKAYITTLLETAFDATRNTSFLEPLRLEAQIAQEYIDDPDPRADPGTRKWAGMILGSKAVGTYQSILDKYQLPGGGPSSTLWRPISVVDSCENGYNYIRKCYPLMTTEASATDRVLFVGVPNPFLIYTGGYIGGALLAPQFTYSGLERDFAAMVRDANTRTANISIYGFFEGEREASIMPWSLEIGGRYSITVGPDADSDGNMDSVDSVDDLTFLSRGQKVPISLIGEIEYLITIQQVEAGSGLRPLMADPAFHEEDEVVVDKEAGTVTVRVHNIGSEDTENVDIYLYEDLDGGLRHIGGALDVTIPAPSGLEPSIEEVDLHVWKEPWIGEVVIIIDPDDEMMEICGSNNELWGYWDLEGIKITEPDMPIVMNGTIPTIYVNEDEPVDNALDLSHYIWDPDGRGLGYSVEPAHYSFQWLSEMNGSMVSFHPSPLFGENWSGKLAFNGAAWGPGSDGVWDTDDDTDTFYFDVILEVIPVNDAPVLEAIVVNGTRHNATGFGFKFIVEYGDAFVGEIIWSDVDGDDAIIKLEEPSGSLSLENYTLTLGTYEEGEVILTHLSISDGNGSGSKRIPLSIYIGEYLESGLLGLTYYEGLIFEPYDGEGFNLTFFEREEVEFQFVFQNAPEGYIVELNDPDGILEGSGLNWTISGIDVMEGSELFEVQLGWSLYPENEQIESFYLRVLVIERDTTPYGLRLNLNDTYYIDEEVKLEINEASDPYDNPLTYLIDWGDGKEPVAWAPGEPAVHSYLEPGNYTIIVTVTNVWGEEDSVNRTITVTERPEPVDDDEGEDDDAIDTKDEGTLTALIAALIIVIVVVLIGFIFFMVRSKEDEEEYYEEEDELGPLEAAIASSMEE